MPILQNSRRKNEHILSFFWAPSRNEYLTDNALHHLTLQHLFPLKLDDRYCVILVMRSMDGSKSA